jgi:hypothetical protein
MTIDKYKQAKMKREMISTNCYKGRRIKADELVKLAKEKRQVYLEYVGQVMPAGFLVMMQFGIVMRRVSEGLFLVEKIKKEKKNALVEMARDRAKKRRCPRKPPIAASDEVEYEFWYLQ